MQDIENDGLVVVPVDLAELKRAMAAYSSRENEILAELYATFHRLRDQYYPGQMEDIVLALIKLNNKTLAHYMPKNGYNIPHCIEFNATFIALNLGDKEPVELDRDIVTHVLLHEMIHHWQTLQGESHANQQSAHGRSFRREAKRLGVDGVGRLMKCPYPVKMPGRAAPGVGDQPDQGDSGEDEPEVPPVKDKAYKRGVIADGIIELGKGYRDRKFGLEDFEKGVHELLKMI